MNKKDSKLLMGQVEMLKTKFGFKGLWHFTDFSNLKLIFDVQKLYSRNYCEENKIDFLDGANHEVTNRASDYVKNCTRFYYRPKTPTLYDNEGIKGKAFIDSVHIPIPVYLLFSEELIYSDTTKFSSGNATRSPIGNDHEFFKQIDWEFVFYDGWFYEEERNHIVNVRHAELLSEEPVSIDYLIGIYFRSNADLKRAVNLFGENKLFKVDNSIFSNKNYFEKDSRYINYIKDYEIEYTNEYVEINIMTKNMLGNFELSWSIEDKNNKTYSLEENLVAKFENRLGSTDKVEEASTFKFRFNYDVTNGDLLKVYLNGFLSIEEIVDFDTRRNSYVEI